MLDPFRGETRSPMVDFRQGEYSVRYIKTLSKRHSLAFSLPDYHFSNVYLDQSQKYFGVPDIIHLFASRLKIEIGPYVS